MDSASTLRARTGGRWPSLRFSLDENRADLEMHDEEQRSRIAFTYTVLSSSKAECLGCVYINPIERWCRRLEVDVPAWIDDSSRAAVVSLWVVPGESESGGEAALVADLRVWLGSHWSFGDVVFLTTEAEPHQARIFESQSLEARARHRDPKDSVDVILHG